MKTSNSENFETFENDCFDRKSFAENLYTLIKNQDEFQTRVISIKSDFGYGKTFFAKAFKNMIEEKREKNNNPHLYCHYIDIWKEDYNNQPLLALLLSLNELTGKINFFTSVGKQKLKKAIGILTLEIGKEIMPYIPGLPDMEKVISEIQNEDPFQNLNTLKKISTNIASAFEELKENHKIILIIDEIDRCHPEYAIEFLETLKHFFDVKNLYFIIMMNENHLKDKVKNKFGYIDFDMWKDKFINLFYELPNTKDQEKFMKYLAEKKYELPQNLETLPIQLQPMYWDKFLWHFALSAGISLNNRQLDSIFFQLKQTMVLLKNKEIVPELIVGIIVRNYIAIEEGKIQPNFDQLPDNLRCRFLKKSPIDGTPIHILKFISQIEGIVSKEKNLILYKNNDQRTIGSLSSEQIDNIVAAQFALQGTLS